MHYDETLKAVDSLFSGGRPDVEDAAIALLGLTEPFSVAREGLPGPLTRMRVRDLRKLRTAAAHRALAALAEAEDSVPIVRMTTWNSGDLMAQVLFANGEFAVAVHGVFHMHEGRLQPDGRTSALVLLGGRQPVLFAALLDGSGDSADPVAKLVQGLLAALRRRTMEAATLSRRESAIALDDTLVLLATRAAFEARFGRSRVPGDPIFFEIGSDCPVPALPHRRRVAFVGMLRLAGVPEAALADKNGFPLEAEPTWGQELLALTDPDQPESSAVSLEGALQRIALQTWRTEMGRDPRQGEQIFPVPSDVPFAGWVAEHLGRPDRFRAGALAAFALWRRLDRRRWDSETLAEATGELSIHVYRADGALVAFSDGVGPAELYVSGRAADGESEITDIEELNALTVEIAQWAGVRQLSAGTGGQVVLPTGRRVVVRVGEALPASEVPDVAAWLSGRDCVPIAWEPLEWGPDAELF